MTSLRMSLALLALAGACASETPSVAPGGGGRPDGDSGPGGDGDVDPGFGDGDSGDGDSGDWEENCEKDVDVVFVVDVSGTMGPALSKIVDEVGKVHEALLNRGLPSEPRYGLVTFVDDVLVQNGGQPYTDVDALIQAVSLEVAASAAGWRQATDPITNPNASWPENSLDALYAAAKEFPWRDAEATHRTIIHVTDASFWDGTNVSSRAGDPENLEPPGGCSFLGAMAPLQLLVDLAGGTCRLVSSQHSYDETIEALRSEQIWTNTFAAKTGGPPTGQPVPASHGIFRGTQVNVGIGFHEPYDGKPSIAESTGGLAWDLDEVYDGKISLATPIIEAIERTQCMSYPIY